MNGLPSRRRRAGRRAAARAASFVEQPGRAVDGLGRQHDEPAGRAAARGAGDLGVVVADLENIYDRWRPCDHASAWIIRPCESKCQARRSGHGSLRRRRPGMSARDRRRHDRDDLPACRAVRHGRHAHRADARLPAHQGGDGHRRPADPRGAGGDDAGDARARPRRSCTATRRRRPPARRSTPAAANCSTGWRARTSASALITRNSPAQRARR